MDNEVTALSKLLSGIPESLDASRSSNLESPLKRGIIIKHKN